MSKNREEVASSRRIVRGLAFAVTVAAFSQLVAVSHAIAAPLPGEMSGSAGSLSLFIGASTVASPMLRSASVGCPCNGTNGVARATSIASIALGASGSLISAANTTATALGTNKNGLAATIEGAEVTKLNLLGGLITADAITSRASVGATPSTLKFSDEGTTVSNLVIAGTSIDPAVPDNTTIVLPGLGSVIVKAVTKTGNNRRAAILVHGLLVEISADNSFGLPVGSRITVASAGAGYSRVEPAAFQEGSAVAAELTGDASSSLDTAVGLGKGVGLPSCTGTAGATLEGGTGALDIPGVASAVSERSTAFGGPVGTALVTKTTSTLSNVSLLGGLITANTISAVAQVSRTGNISSTSSAGSGLTGLMVAGVAVPASSPANLKLTLPGIGDVIVNEQSAGALGGRIEVIGLDVEVTHTNLLGIPVGARLMLGRATATVRRF